MEISALTLKLIILLIPGALGTLIMNRLTIRKELSPFKFMLNAIIIGVFSYLLLQLFSNTVHFISNIFSCQTGGYKQLQIWSSISDKTIIPYEEVLYSSICSIIIAILGSLIDQYKIINKLAQKLGISNKYGDENLFSYFLNAKETQIVYIRNIKNNLTYHGYVNSYSETNDLSEIVLSNVSVYRYDDSSLLYEVDQIYLSFAKNEIIIEHAKIIENGKETESTDTKTAE